MVSYESKLPHVQLRENRQAVAMCGHQPTAAKNVDNK
jgi:hypothetical protein